MTNNEAVLEAIDNEWPFSWISKEMQFVHSAVHIERDLSRLKSDGERLHDIYDGNGRMRSNGGFC
jgi:hypothetical protein